MFILDNLENTGKQNEENNYQGSQYPFLLKHHFLSLFAAQTPSLLILHL